MSTYLSNPVDSSVASKRPSLSSKSVLHDNQCQCIDLMKKNLINLKKQKVTLLVLFFLAISDGSQS